MSNLTIEEITDTEKFESLKHMWNNLLQESCDNNVFLTWDWLFTWWKHYGGDKKLRIILIKDSGRIIGIAPLMQSRYRKGIISFDVLENICSSQNCDYSGVILIEREEEAVSALLEYLEKIVSNSNIIVRISQIPESNSFLTLLRKQYPAFSKSLILDEKIITSCPYILLPVTWDEYFRSMRRKRQKNLRRALRSLQKKYLVEFKKYNENENLRERIQILFELHQKRWEARKLSSRFSHREEAEFCMEVSNLFSQNGWLDLSFLTIDGKAVSAVWGFKYNQEFYYMTPTFDPEYSDYSVGNLHIMNLIEDAIKNGLRRFDFLKGDEIYKRYWSRSTGSNVQVVLMKRRFATSAWLRLFYMFMRLDEISKRSLRVNYLLYLNKRRQQKAIRIMDTSAATGRPK